MSKIRFTAIAVADGWRKLTVSCAATLKLCQLSERFWLAWVMLVLAPDCTMLPVPATTCPPEGAAIVWAENIVLSERAAAMSLRLEFLPRPLAVSATATQAFCTWLQTSR